jgi:murein DD-endopeptidase MepM/ murein hydrolase activator NlpD
VPRILIPVAIIILCIWNGCTPAPKYRARPPASELTAGERNSRPDSIPSLGIRLIPPVKDFTARRITSPFGTRARRGSGGSGMHEGIDIKARAGEEIIAAASGSVAFAGRQRGYGNVVIVDHGSGIHTLYAHLFYACVRRGESVGAGQRIGRAGKRGSARGTHLHFELRRHGAALDPTPYLWLDSGTP